MQGLGRTCAQGRCTGHGAAPAQAATLGEQAAGWVPSRRAQASKSSHVLGCRQSEAHRAVGRVGMEAMGWSLGPHGGALQTRTWTRTCRSCSGTARRMAPAVCRTRQLRPQLFPGRGQMALGEGSEAVSSPVCEI